MSVPSHRAAAAPRNARTASALPSSYHPSPHSLGAVARTASHLGGGGGPSSYETAASMARTAAQMDPYSHHNYYQAAGFAEPPPHFGAPMPFTARELYASSAANPVGYSAMDLYGAHSAPTMGLTAHELYGGLPLQHHTPLGYSAMDLYGGAGGGVPHPVYPMY
jgi:hypothetical protein